MFIIVFVFMLLQSLIGRKRLMIYIHHCVLTLAQQFNIRIENSISQYDNKVQQIHNKLTMQIPLFRP